MDFHNDISIREQQTESSPLRQGLLVIFFQLSKLLTKKAWLLELELKAICCLGTNDDVTRWKVDYPFHFDGLVDFSNVRSSPPKTCQPVAVLSVEVNLWRSLNIKLNVFRSTTKQWILRRLYTIQKWTSKYRHNGEIIQKPRLAALWMSHCNAHKHSFDRPFLISLFINIIGRIRWYSVAPFCFSKLLLQFILRQSRTESCPLPDGGTTWRYCKHSFLKMIWHSNIQKTKWINTWSSNNTQPYLPKTCYSTHLSTRRHAVGSSWRKTELPRDLFACICQLTLRILGRLKRSLFFLKHVFTCVYLFFRTNAGKLRGYCFS